MTQSVKEDRQFRLSTRRLWKELLEVFHEIGCRAKKLRDLRLDVQDGCRASLVSLQDC